MTTFPNITVDIKLTTVQAEDLTMAYEDHSGLILDPDDDPEFNRNLIADTIVGEVLEKFDMDMIDRIYDTIEIYRVKVWA